MAKAAEPLKAVGRGVRKVGGDPDAMLKELKADARQERRRSIPTRSDERPAMP